MKVLPIILLLLATAACSTYRPEFDANPSFAPHYFRNLDVEITWQTERKGQEIRLSGAVTNHRPTYMRDLELTIRLLDEKGSVLARALFADFPTYITTGTAAPFQISFRLPDGTVPSRLRFRYAYQLAEEEPSPVTGFSGYENIPYFGNFDAPL